MLVSLIEIVLCGNLRLLLPVKNDDVPAKEQHRTTKLLRPRILNPIYYSKGTADVEVVSRMQKGNNNNLIESAFTRECVCRN